HGGTRSYTSIRASMATGRISCRSARMVSRVVKERMRISSVGSRAAALWGGHFWPRPLAGQGARRGAGGPPHKGSEARQPAGVPLLDLLIVITIVAAMAGLAYPSISASLDGLRLRSAADGIAGFLNTALDRAERRQEVIEVAILPQENALTAR